MSRAPLAALAAAGLLLAACENPEGTMTSPEISETSVKLDLPAVPSFQPPQPYPDGTHSVLEMRRNGKKFLDNDVRVKGYVTWVYDCAAVHGEQVVKDTPEKCDRPHFMLGDSVDAPPQKAIMVVDVPRPPREDEKKFLPEEDLKNWPEVPEYKVGDHIIVDGKWTTKSPLGFVDSDGLLVYQNLTHLDQMAGTPQ